VFIIQKHLCVQVGKGLLYQLTIIQDEQLQQSLPNNKFYQQMWFAIGGKTSKVLYIEFLKKEVDIIATKV